MINKMKCPNTYHDPETRKQTCVMWGTPCKYRLNRDECADRQHALAVERLQATLPLEIQVKASGAKNETQRIEIIDETEPKDDYKHFHDYEDVWFGGSLTERPHPYEFEGGSL